MKSGLYFRMYQTNFQVSLWKISHYLLQTQNEPAGFILPPRYPPGGVSEYHPHLLVFLRLLYIRDSLREPKIEPLAERVMPFIVANRVLFSMMFLIYGTSTVWYFEVTVWYFYKILYKNTIP